MVEKSVILDMEGNDNFDIKMDTLKVPSDDNIEADTSDDDDDREG